MNSLKVSKVMKWSAATTLAACLAAFAFHQGRPKPDSAGTGNTLAETGKDFFPDKVRVKYAKGFSIRYYPGYKVAEVVNPFNASADTTRYVLFPRGEPRPKGFSHAVFVEVPVRTLACLSTTHIGITNFLGVNDQVVAMSDTDRVLNTDIKRRILEGKIVEVGRDQMLNQELVLTISPDLLMTVGFPGREMGAFNALMESGITVVTNSEWMETSMMGRMEWVKLLAVFLNKEGLAEAKFDSIERKYEEVKRIAAGAEPKPKVIGGISRKGVWTVPGGRSYVAALIKDAGADFPWSDDTTTGSRNLGFETVYQKALEADFWLNAGWTKSLKDIADEDPRFQDFKSFKNKAVFNNTKRIATNGSNDYWESGLVNPHIILSDFVKILHPEKMPDHELYYTFKLE